jgi:alpha-glucosidase (family GH31 glycosyl hydrolase)
MLRLIHNLFQALNLASFFGADRLYWLGLFLCATATLNSPLTFALPSDPKASSSSTVEFGPARFTVLSPQLIRMEYSAQHHFEDRASLTFINRRLPSPKFTQKIIKNTLRIKTNEVELWYLNDGAPFNENNLHLDLGLDNFNDSKIKNNNKKVRWQPHQVDKGNLKGTLPTLDQAKGWSFEANLEQGILSRGGWALIDDSNSPLFDGNPDWNWVTTRTDNHLDWYLFAYGTDYKQALYDYTLVAGKTPMPPKYAFGYWWSRYWIYNDNELRELVEQFRNFSIPQDVLIIDMDWHETYGFQGKKAELDPEGQLKGWTGYTWNKKLFPEPKKFIQWTNEQSLKTALNLHPASGIPTMEEKYTDFAKAYGVNNAAYIAFNMSDKRWANTYFETILKPMEDWGIDFWWLDWQQYPYDKKIPNLTNLWWLNYAFFTHNKQPTKRPMIFHRWGGLGNHRYPIGFSGDAHTDWETLDFETYFTATAANVGYGYWSHDIGGHISNDKPTDGELYLRWIQFGVFSPILRTHSSKISLIERRPWMFPQHFSAMRDAIKLRYHLAPYIYNAARTGYDRGIAIVHPLYYDYPDNEEAYSFKTQYLFGNDMLIAPITTPIDTKTQLAEKTIWLPKGEWFEFSSGTLLEGNRVVKRHYAVDEIPFWVKAGSIIPTLPEVKNLQEKSNNTILTIIPGKNASSTELYSDDETSNGYQEGEFSRQKVFKKWLTDKKLRINIEPSVGSYSQIPSTHFFTIDLVNCFLPNKVTVNGKALSQALAPEFLHKELLSRIRLPELPINSQIDIDIEFDRSYADQNRLFNGNKGFLKRVSQATEKLKYAAALTDWGGTLPNEVYEASNITNELLYNPEQAADVLEKLNILKKPLRNIILNIPNLSKETTVPVIDYLDYHE